MYKEYDAFGIKITLETNDCNYQYKGWPTALVCVDSDTRSWFKEFRLLPMRPPCPVCEGEGGWKEQICVEIGGPYHACEFCKRTGVVSWFDLIRYRFWERHHYSWLGNLLIEWNMWVDRPTDQYRVALHYWGTDE